MTFKGFIRVLILLTSTAPMPAEAVEVFIPPTTPQTAPMSASELSNLEMVLQWWREVVQAHHTELADKYQAEDYIQHNPNIPTGRAAFVKVFSKVPPINPIPEKLARPPVVEGAKGDFVWLVFEDEARDPHDASKTYHYDSFDLLRIENGKIQEHWDSQKRVSGSPDFVPSNAPAPSTWKTRTPSFDEQRNIRIANEISKEVSQYGHLGLAKRKVDPGCIQHDPNVIQGPEGFKGFTTYAVDRRSTAYSHNWKNGPALTLADGSYVLMMWNVNDKDPTDSTKLYMWNHFDLFRIEGGLVKEHWDEAKIEPRKVSVDVSVMNTYPGQYALSSHSDIAVTLEDGHLAVQEAGRPKLALAAESNTMFFLENTDTVIEFTKNEQGKVTGLIVHQAGRDIKASRH